VIIQVRHELTSYDLALAVASFADYRTGSTESVGEWIQALTKTEIRELARQRVTTTGDNTEYWGDPPADLVSLAREHINYLWPKGA
jgi:hypothetical protein